MALIKIRMTARKLAANRSNAQKSTGPRTLRGKLQSRLNALKDGRYSVLLSRYFRLWSFISFNGPLNPPPGWRISQMPVPILSHDGDLRRGAEIREFLRRAAPFLPLSQRGLPRLAELAAGRPVSVE